MSPRPRVASNGCPADNHEDAPSQNPLPGKNSTGNPGNQLSNDQGLGSNRNNANQSDGGESNSGSGHVDIDDRDSNNHIQLHGLFYLGLLNRKPNQQIFNDHDAFFLCRAFWTDHAILSEKCVNYISNSLEMFTVSCDTKFFQNTKQKHMAIELWQKLPNEPEKMIGAAKIPLHQFHIAFHETNVMNRVIKQKMPVISIDGWTDFISTSTKSPSIPIGSCQVLLAIGTQEQINHLKNMKNLMTFRSFLHEPQEQLPHASRIAFPNYQILSPIPRPITIANHIPIPSNPLQNDPIQRRAQLAARLNTFIENLASELPDQMSKTGSCIQNNANHMNLKTFAPNSNQESQSPIPAGKNIRATADLLDELQRALTSASNMRRSTTAPGPDDPGSNSTEGKFCVLIEIESAVNLPKQVIKLNRKHVRRGHHQGNATIGQREGSINEIEPDSYVTFIAYGPTTNMVNTHDGPVYTTNVINKNCNPQWNKRFEVYLPVEMLLDNNKHFELKVWRKASNDILQARLIPSPIDDAIIGVVRVDLTVLLNQQFNICGWFDVLNSSEQINGQIKINIEPKEDLQIYRDKKQSMEIHAATCTDDTNSSNDMIDDFTDIQAPFSLNRILKRKFNELEEITERLRARLLDVTDDNDNDNGEIDKDDEFESDLNTKPDEDCDEWSFFDASNDDTLNWVSDTTNGESSFQSSSSNIQLIAEALGNSEINEKTTNDGTIIMAQSHDTAP